MNFGDMLITIGIAWCVVAVAFFAYAMILNYVHGEIYIRVNQTTCLQYDATERLYDKKECYVKANEENIKDFCNISKGAEPEWCDPDVITDLLSKSDHAAHGDDTESDFGLCYQGYQFACDRLDIEKIQQLMNDTIWEFTK